VPFFQVMSTKGPTGKIQTAGLYNKQTVDADYYTRMGTNITFRIKRREALISTDGKGSSMIYRLERY
jgi:hypothetical protein